MIGPNLRKALRWAAVFYILYNVGAAVMQIIEIAERPSIYSAPWQFVMMAGAALVSALIQAGILLVLLSIDERMGVRRATAGIEGEGA